MTDKTLVEVAKDDVALATGAGARQAAATASRDREVELSWRDGQVEKLSEATTAGLALELYVDGRYATVSTSDLRPEALRRFVEDAVEVTRALSPDPHRGLADPGLCARGPFPDLDLVDGAARTLEPAARRAAAQALEAAARGADRGGAILSVTTGVGDGLSEQARVHSDGFVGLRTDTTFQAWADVSVKDPDGRRPEEGDYAYGRHLSALPDPALIGRAAAERALGRIGSAKGDSGPRTVVVANRAAGRLLSFLLQPLGAAALQQKRSFLDGKLGQAVGSPRLSLADDPLVPRAIGSRAFDGEGLAARRFPVFEQGVLKSYYVDVYYGRKLSLAPTTRGPSNLVWNLGTKGLEGLVADAGEGLLVTGFLGGNSNATTGDFSLGVKGFRIAGGRVGAPLGEMNLSGNHLDLWKKLAAVGSDPYPYSSMKTPTLVFEGVQFAGT
jgi:PmbA protein